MGRVPHKTSRRLPRVTVFVSMRSCYGPSVMRGIFAHIAEHGEWRLDIVRFEKDVSERIIYEACAHHANGFIVAVTDTFAPSNTLLASGIPFVTIDRFFSVSVPCVAADNFSGGRMAAHQLAARGCRRVAFMRIGSTLTNEPSKRRDGFISGCLEENMTYECMLLEDGASEEEFGVFLKNHMVDGKLEFDGLFCGTDTVAYRVIRMLRGMNLRVPEDVQVIGFDGIRMFGNQNYVCSTIVQPVPAIAETCVNMVLSPDFGALPPLICLPVSYADGGTTKPVVAPEKLPD